MVKAHQQQSFYRFLSHTYKQICSKHKNAALGFFLLLLKFMAPCLVWVHIIQGVLN